MVAWTIQGMGGVNPRTDRRLVGDNQAVEAVNCDLGSGAIDGLPTPEFVVDLTGTLPVVEKAYFLADADGSGGVYLPLPSKFSSVARSPLTDDAERRVYWTNPGDPAPWWSTYARIQAGAPNYNLGIVVPTAILSVSVSGGDTSVPLIERSYTYTFINEYGEESPPAPGSVVVAGPGDGTWTITGIPTGPPANPAGLNYPTPVFIRLYRTITSATSGTQFYRFGQFGLPWPATFVDTVLDEVVVNNLILESTSWANPPTGLDGLVAMPNGFFVGFFGNTLAFSEPSRPHAWPPGYQQSVHYDIVVLAVLQQYLMVLTKGYPSVGSGNLPSNLVLVQSQVPEPCIARGSVIVDLQAVYFASQNGLVQITGYGMQVITLLMVDKNQWLNEYHAKDIVACRHRAMFLAINQTGAGFLIDYAEKRIGFVKLNTFSNAVSVWNEESSGDAYIMADGKIYLWDSPVTPPLTYRWRSRQFFTPSPISLGACQVTMDEAIYDPAPTIPPALDNGDTTLVLPAGINAQFRLYAGPKRALVTIRNLTKHQEIFRLPKGFKAFEYEAEIVARVRCASIQLATTLNELKKV